MTHDNVMIARLSQELRMQVQDIEFRKGQMVSCLRLTILPLIGLLVTSAVGIGQVFPGASPGAAPLPDVLPAVSSAKQFPSVAYGWFGLLVWLVAFGSSWAYTMFLGHALPGLVVVRKNAAHIRSLAYGSTKILCDGQDADRTVVPGIYGYFPYIMLIPNGAIGLWSIYFFRFTFGCWDLGLLAGFFMLAILSIWYPRVCCVFFQRQLTAAKRVRPGIDYRQALDHCRDAARKRRERVNSTYTFFSRIFAGAVVAIGSVLMWEIVIHWHDTQAESYSHTGRILFAAAIVLIALTSRSLQFYELFARDGSSMQAKWSLTRAWLRNLPARFSSAQRARP